MLSATASIKRIGFLRKSLSVSRNEILGQWFSPNAFSRHLSTVADVEARANQGSIEDMLSLGRKLFDHNENEKAGYWLKKAAELDNQEAQYLLGVMLVTQPTEPTNNTTTTSQSEDTIINSAADVTEVRKQIMKLRKDSMFVKRTKNSNMSDFNEALRKRKEKLENQQLHPTTDAATLTTDTSTTRNTTSATTAAATATATATTATTVDNPFSYDRVAGLHWLQVAAQHGHGAAMCFLANQLLAEGQGMLMDSQSKASGSGSGSDRDSGRELKVVRKDGADPEKGVALIQQAVEWYKLAADPPGLNAAAAYNLGVLYHDGVEHSMPVLTKPVGDVDVVSAKKSKSVPSYLEDIVVTKVSNSKINSNNNKGNIANEVTATESATIVNPSTSTVATTTTPTLTTPTTSTVRTVLLPADLPASLRYFQQAAALGEPAAQLWCGYCYSTAEGGADAVYPQRALDYLQSALAYPETAAKAHFYLAQIYRSGLSGLMADSSMQTAEVNVEKDNNKEEEVEMVEEVKVEADTSLFLHHLQAAVVQNQGQSQEEGIGESDVADEDALYLLADLHLQRYVALEAAAAEKAEGDEEEQVDVVAYLLADLLESSKNNYANSALKVANKVDPVLPHVHTAACGGTHACTHDHDHDHHHHHHHHHSSTSSPTPTPTSTPTPTTAASPASADAPLLLSHPSPPPSPPPLPLSKQHLLRSVSLLVQASSMGQAEATLTLGALAYQGHLPPQRDAEDGAPVSHKRRAFELYQLAAEQGSLDAWRNVASMHYLGDGVPKSEDLAREIMRVVFGGKKQ